MTMEKKERTLPDKPSELILIALKDLESCIEDDRYVIDMGEWHGRQTNAEKCSVCLAGAVMAKSMDSDIDITLLPSGFDAPNSYKFSALNAVRQGDVETYLQRLQSAGCISESEFEMAFEKIGFMRWEVIEYNPSPEGDELGIDDYEPFKKSMIRIATELESVEL
jgi:hypothetical protein